MSETPTTPRITTSYLDQFPNRTVRMVGKVILLRGEEAKIDCDGEVRILLGRDAHLQVGNAVEIVGKVNQDLSIKVLRATDFGNNFGMYNSLFPYSPTNRVAILETSATQPKPGRARGAGEQQLRTTQANFFSTPLPDFKAMNALVDATHRYNEIWYGDN
ncbi:hypothetical protein ACMFMF_001878 [Clarireedia jacksonii]